uniref:Uncharacterized protein n=1 Tax=Rousettus aegyptiacus TaxID=9407 RepID=A0A7J8DXE6_ROUAE|nr:hypothetical protein HJG63_008279 [Rousettus aegyptiacus]
MRLRAQVIDLQHVEKERQAGHGQHEDDEDGLLRGPGDEAVHGVGAGPLVTAVEWLQLKAVQEVLAGDEAHLEQHLEDGGEDVGPEQRPGDADLAPVVPHRGPVPLAAVAVPVRLLRVPLFPLLFHAHDVQHVAQVKSDCSSPHTDSTPAPSTRIRKMNSTVSQTLPVTVECSCAASRSLPRRLQSPIAADRQPVREQRLLIRSAHYHASQG